MIKSAFSANGYGMKGGERERERESVCVCVCVRPVVIAVIVFSILF